MGHGISQQGDVGAILREHRNRIRALEATPPGDPLPDHIVYFDRDFPFNEDTFLFMQLDGVVSIGDPYGLHVRATAEPGGILLEQGSGANFSQLHLYNTATGDGTVHLQGRAILNNADATFQVRDGAGLNAALLIDCTSTAPVGIVRMPTLPTVDPGTLDGAIWNSGGTLKISI